MPELLKPIIRDENIKLSITKRKRSYIEKTIEGNNSDILDQKAKLEEYDNWHILRKNKKSYRLKKDKPASEQLEPNLSDTIKA